jgi:hypothetical protein
MHMPEKNQIQGLIHGNFIASIKVEPLTKPGMTGHRLFPAGMRGVPQPPPSACFLRS